MGKAKMFWRFGNREVSPKWMSEVVSETIEKRFSF